MASKYGKWILQGPAHLERPEVPPEKVRVRLFAIPQAGCGAWAYHGWTKKLPEWVEVMPIELPGRNSRMTEPKQKTMSQLVTDIVDELTPLFREMPFVLIGHSMGSWLCYEMAKLLERRGEALPQKIYAVCNRSPSFYGPANDPDQESPTLSKLDAVQFWPAFERRYGKNPDLAKPSIQNFIFPILQADFALLETYTPSDPSFAPLPCDLTACGAKGDSRYSPEQLSAWQQHTSGKYSEMWFEGRPEPDYWGTSHRFLIDCPEKFQLYLSEDLSKY